MRSTFVAALLIGLPAAVPADPLPSWNDTDAKASIIESVGSVTDPEADTYAPTAGDGPRLGMLVHHTDAEREFAYDREGDIGVFGRGLDEAGERGWLLVDMAGDWEQVWPDAE
jgi:hypothetical protein